VERREGRIEKLVDAPLSRVPADYNPVVLTPYSASAGLKPSKSS
jgi:hypothetical protein